MPLKKSASKEAGKPQEPAGAIALKVQRRAKKKGKK